MRVKNISGEEQVWCGQTIANESTHDIAANELFKWQSNDKVIADLSSGDLEIGDGVTYKSPGASAIQFLLGADTSPKDVTGRAIVRPAITIEGWGAQFHSVGFTIGVLNSVYNKDDNGNDLGFTTLKFYDEDGIEQTTQEDITANAVKTVLGWMPSHDYEIIGGQLNQAYAPEFNMYMWAKGLPGILNIMFAQGGLNLKLCPAGSIVDFDGKASKFLPYNGGAGTNKFEFIFKHGVGVTHELQFLLKIFKG